METGTIRCFFRLGSRSMDPFRIDAVCFLRPLDDFTKRKIVFFFCSCGLKWQTNTHTRTSDSDDSDSDSSDSLPEFESESQ
jgi:hypothetical protein